MKIVNTKKIILLIAVEPHAMRGITDNYALAGTYGFEYLKASVEKDNVISGKFDIRILRHPDGAIDEEMADAATMENVYAAGFSVSIKNLRRAMTVARQMKLANPEIKIIAGGPQAFAAGRLLNEYEFVDYAVSGEGERTFCELLAAAGDARAMLEIKGLTWRDDNKIVDNPPREPVVDINELPRVITRKRAAGFRGVVLYESSRGCRHSCSYCLWSPYPKRYFSMKRVKAELLAILNNPGVSRIWFVDSDFDSDTARAEEILRFIDENNPHGAQVSAFLSFDNPSKKLLELTGKLFYEVPVGLQTVNMDLQKALGRSWFDIKKFEASIPLILKYVPAEKLYMDLMFGLPGEKPGDFFESVSWCAARGLTHLNFFRLGVYPGAGLEKRAAAAGLVFDFKPPHFVYSSNTFSYGDIVAIEHAAINYKIISGIYGRDAIIELARSKKLIPAIKTLRKDERKWAGLYEIVDETNICNLDLKQAAELAEKELKNILGGTGLNHSALRDREK